MSVRERYRALGDNAKFSVWLTLVLIVIYFIGLLLIAIFA